MNTVVTVQWMRNSLVDVANEPAELAAAGSSMKAKVDQACFKSTFVLEQLKQVVN
jgi:hypothetical protein